MLSHRQADRRKITPPHHPRAENEMVTSHFFQKFNVPINSSFYEEAPLNFLIKAGSRIEKIWKPKSVRMMMMMDTYSDFSHDQNKGLNHSAKNLRIGF